MKKRFDVLGLGCTAVDEILYVPRYPRPDGKVEVRQREKHCGGLCATALVAAARLGSSCVYAGTLGDDTEARFVRTTLEREGICLQHLVHSSGAGPVRSVIVVDETHGTRNIFYDTSKALGAHPTKPSADLIRQARVLMVDRFGIPGMIRAARIAREANVGVVADFESAGQPRLAQLLALADHLLLSRDFACSLTKTHSPQKAAAKLWRSDRQAVVVTAGAEGCWFLQESGEKNARHFPAYRVSTCDTTGCGDVFHGAYSSALARGLPLEERLRIASAAAALKATAHGGQAGIPTAKQLRAFLSAND